MKPGQKLEITLVDETGRPIQVPGVILTISFSMGGRHRYGFRSVASDTSGGVHITYENLEVARVRNLASQPADFKSRLEECDEIVKVSLPSLEELRRAADTLETMGQGKWPEIAQGWREAANWRLQAREILVATKEVCSGADLVCKTLPLDGRI